MGWKQTGGGWYECGETGDRVRGKRNLPEGAEIVPLNDQDVGEEDVLGPPTRRLVCMSCHKVTKHTQRPTDDPVWAFYTCSKCGGKTKVRLN